MNTVSATLNGDEDRRVFPAAVVQLVVVSSHKSKSLGQFSSQGTCLSCGFNPWPGHEQEASCPGFYLALMYLFLSPFLSH